MPAPLPHHPFYFLRHGQTDWNLQGRLQGHTDIPLNATGLDQAHAAADMLADQGIDIIVSIPLIEPCASQAVGRAGRGNRSAMQLTQKEGA